MGIPILVGECDPVKEYLGNTASYCNPKSYNDAKLFFNKSIKAPRSKSDVIFNSEYSWETCVKSLESIYDQ